MQICIFFFFAWAISRKFLQQRGLKVVIVFEKGVGLTAKWIWTNYLQSVILFQNI